MMENLTIESNIKLQEATERTWDIIVIGAGVAGASTAILAAQRGWNVLLIESKRFPREKVCGGCLNARATHWLEQLGILERVRKAGAVDLERLNVQIGSTGCSWKLPRLLSVRRSTLDSLLVERAMEVGVRFLQETTATIDEETVTDGNSISVDLQLRSVGSTQLGTARAHYTVVACGLTRSALASRDDWPSVVAPNSRIGVHCLLPVHAIPEDLLHADKLGKDHPSVLHMLVGPNGYVGICRADGDFFDFAAALDPKKVSGKLGIPRCVDELMISCGWNKIPAIYDVPWLSTPHLTRTTTIVARKRLFLVGDSVGYVEPFTGEGMSWALAGAFTLVPILDSAIRTGENNAAEFAWNAWVSRQRHVSQSVCRWVASQARRPDRARWALRVCDWIPPLRHFLLRKATQ
ncbi:MAG: FAD-dependent oxidoreductase [Planctomycetota bacterium]